METLKTVCRQTDALQLLRAEKADAITIAQVLLVDKYFKADLPDQLKWEEYLLNDQIKSTGWGYETCFYDMATTEATCMALLAMHEKYASNPEVQVGLNWLRRNAIRSLQDEGWGILPGDISRVHTTCLALQTLHQYGKTNTYEYERGLYWLLNAQNPDKGWGSKPGDASNITYTSRVIITLISLGYESNSEILRSAVHWLKSHTKSILTKANISFEYHESIELRSRRLSFWHMPVQTVLIALLLSGNTKSYTMLDGVHSLIKYNNDHFWNHPSFQDGTRKPLWAIFDTHYALSAVVPGFEYNRILNWLGLHGDGKILNSMRGVHKIR